MIKLNNIRKSFARGNIEVPVLKDLNLEIHSGEMLAIMGRSGAGKSTLLNILSGLVPIDSGTYTFDNRVLNTSSPAAMNHFRSRSIGMVLQTPALLEDYSVFENIALPLKYMKIKNADVEKTVYNILERIDLHDKINAYPYELSGGQQQRVAIGRAIVNNPKIILADEPTGSLDIDTENSIMKLFEELHNLGKTIIIVTHNPDIAARSQKTIYIRDGEAHEK